MNGRTSLVTMSKASDIEIRPFQEKDAEPLLDFVVRNRAFLAPFEPVRTEEYFTAEHQFRVIRNAIELALEDRGYTFGIFSKETNQLIGKVALNNIVRGIFYNAYIGYSLDQAHNGKGYMTEAVKWVVRYGFRALLLHRIQAGIMPHNLPSIRVIEKAGFRQEGVAQRYLKINGKWEDHLLYAITVEEEDAWDVE